MNFAPKTEKELAEMNIFPAGIYDFEVLTAEDAVSKTGNEMIKVGLQIFVGSQTKMLTDYLLAKLPHKLRHFCDSTQLLTQYENGSLTAQHCVGKSGKVRIIIDSDDSGTYPDKNAVKDYVKRADFEKGVSTFRATLESPPLRDDGIPF